MNTGLTASQKRYVQIKRFLDFALSLGACILLSPILLLLCIAIKLDNRGPVLFKQKRVGIHKTYFPIYKFRTMRMDTPKDMPTHMLSNPEKYITKTGHFLRKSSLDELPQLFNIIKGDMSFVGPRPALWNQGFWFDVRCFFGTFTSVLRADGVVEGGTGEMKRNRK